jgi:hypothetical protein
MANEIREDIAAYEQMEPTLTAEYMGRWVLIHDGQLIKDFNSFDEAAKDAVSRFGRGPYLIRQVGAPSITLPASVVYRILSA